MAARIFEVVDAVEARLNAWIAANDPGSATVTTKTTIEIPDRAPVGRVVFLLALEESQFSTSTRLQDVNDYTIGVLVVERYSGEGDPPDSWVRSLSAWVQDAIQTPLSAIGRFEQGEIAGVDSSPLLASDETEGLHSESNDKEVYNLQAREEHRMFSSALTFTFREDA